MSADRAKADIVSARSGRVGDVLLQRHDGQNTCGFSETAVKRVTQKYIYFRNTELMI
jgi:hypothetical protein